MSWESWIALASSALALIMAVRAWVLSDRLREQRNMAEMEARWHRMLMDEERARRFERTDQS